MKYPLSEIRTGLEAVLQCVPSKSTLAILKYVRITITPSSLQMIATDLENTGVYTSNYSVEGSLDVCVEAKAFKTCIDMLEDTVTFKLTDSVLLLSDASTKCKCVIVEAIEFPDLPVNAEDRLINKTVISDVVLKNILKVTGPCVSTDFTRPSLTGIYFHAYGVVATDGHKLALLDVPNCCLNSIIAPNTLKLFSNKRYNNILIQEVENRNDKKEVVPPKYIVLTSGNFTVYSKVIEGPYPQYRNVLPTEWVNYMSVDKTSFIKILKKIEPLTNKKTDLIKMSYKLLDSRTLTLTVIDSDRAIDIEKTVSIPQWTGDDFEIGVSCKYLIQLLNTIEDGIVFMEFNNPLGAIKISSAFCIHDFRILMPLRLKDEEA